MIQPLRAKRQFRRQSSVFLRHSERRRRSIAALPIVVGRRRAVIVEFRVPPTSATVIVSARGGLSRTAR